MQPPPPPQTKYPLKFRHVASFNFNLHCLFPYFSSNSFHGPIKVGVVQLRVNFLCKLNKKSLLRKKWGVLQRFTTMIFWQVFTFGKENPRSTSMPMTFIYLLYFYFFLHFAMILQLIYMIEYISIKMISNRNLEYYTITKEGVFFYNSIYFIGSLF